jgi:CMP/dCMP kinase
VAKGVGQRTRTTAATGHPTEAASARPAGGRGTLAEATSRTGTARPDAALRQPGEATDGRPVRGTGTNRRGGAARPTIGHRAVRAAGQMETTRAIPVADLPDEHRSEDAMTIRLDSAAEDQTTSGDDRRRVIAIDGPAAAGKSTVARALADRLGATYLDTGLLYRAVTLVALRAGLSPTDGEGIARLAERSRFDILPPHVPGEPERILLDGEDVTAAVRSEEVERHVSAVSAHPVVRAVLLPIQRAIARNGPVVMVGRDITTVVVPDAGVKVYLDASLAERARRRFAEIRARGDSATYDDILQDIVRRDRADSTRSVAPLRAAAGVTIVDTNGRTVDAIVDEIARLAVRSWQPDREARRTG